FTVRESSETQAVPRSRFGRPHGSEPSDAGEIDFSAGTTLDRSNVRKAWANIIEKAEVRHRRIHDRRHTFASLPIQQGESLVYVKEGPRIDHHHGRHLRPSGARRQPRGGRSSRRHTGI